MSPSSPDDCIPIGSFTLAEDARVLTVNATAVRWLGYTESEIVGRPFHFLLDKGGQFFLRSQVLPMLKLKGSLEEVYLRMRDKAGASVPILANAAYLERGPSLIALAFLRIPQRGVLEDELLRAKKLAEQASDAKTKFLGMMSHELRTPLQAISLINQALLDGAYGDLTAEQTEIIGNSEGSAHSVAVLIEDILNFSRMDGGDVKITVEILPVERAMERAEVAIRHRFKNAGVTCVRQPIQSELVARYDANRLQQILLNLLSNAVKFTPRGGSVTLSARRDGTMVAIDVTDTGCGIPPEQLQRVFEPFVQLHTTIQSGETPGVGLGLSICQGFATAMGGSISVRSAVGLGSTFTVHLQLAQEGS
jgi:signal transduction histidine kinase